MQWSRLGVYQKGARNASIKDLMVSLTSLTDGSVKQGIRKTTEEPPRVSVIDVVSIVAGHTPGQAANTLQRLLEAYPEVYQTLTYFQFNGRGSKRPQSPMRMGLQSS